MGFSTFIGNRKIVERLHAKFREGRLPHGLIFSGPSGVGKHTLALMLAKALNCTAPTDLDYCDSCNQCHKINAGTHPDVFTVTLDPDASQIKIVQVRQVLSMFNFRPLEGANNVFVFDPADRMTQEAANALLKGLEEPPSNTFCILITQNVHELLLTIRSRCQVYHFSPLPLGELQDAGVHDDLILRWSQGSIGRARSLDAQKLKEERDVLVEFLETTVSAEETQLRELLSASADLSRSKDDYSERLRILSTLVADLLYLKEGVSEKIVNIDLRQKLENIEHRVTTQRLVAIAEFLGFIEMHLKKYLNRQMMSDVLALLLNEKTSKIIHDNAAKSP